MILVKDIADGMHVRGEYLVNNLTQGVSNAGKKYLTIVLQDKTGTIDGKKWEIEDGDLEVFAPRHVVYVEGEANFFKNTLQLKILSGTEVPASSVNLDNFVAPAPVAKDVLVKKLDGYLASLKDGELKTLVTAIIAKYRDRFLDWPAAVRNHHAFRSGVLYHSLSMADLAEQVAKLYPTLDRDMLISGCLLHDLGKCIELSGPVATEYTLEGKLLGHINIMADIIREEATRLGISGETPDLLEHMILAHHGKPDFGSPVLPLTREAMALSMIDDFDAKMNMLDKALEGTKPGNWTERIFAFDNRSFYKPKRS